MYQLANITEAEVKECGEKLREAASGVSNMEDAANRIVGFLYDNFGNNGSKACALVRFYKTHPFGELDSDLQEFAKGILGHDPESPDMKCLTLLATRGDKDAWNARAKSQGHKAIPLPSEQFVSKIPMISRLINQFGLELKTVLKPDPAIIVDLREKAYNTFHVPEAVGSPYIPAQDEFVIPHGIQSVLGLGGMLPTGNLFAVILFAKMHIARDAADRCKNLALDVRAVAEPFDSKVFAGAA